MQEAPNTPTDTEDFDPTDPAGVLNDELDAPVTRDGYIEPEWLKNVEPTTRAIGAKTMGRPAGSRNQIVKNAIAEMKASGKQTPLEYLLSVMHDEDEHRFTRMDAAKAAAPYVHAKLASVTTHTPNDALLGQIQKLYFDRLMAMKDSGPPAPTEP